MKKITKFLLASSLALGFASGLSIGLTNNQQNTLVTKAAVVVRTLQIGGFMGGDVSNNIGSARFDPFDHSWDYYADRNLIILRNYVGPRISMIVDAEHFAPVIRLEGECIINVSDSDAGILFENFTGDLHPYIIFDTADASLTINGGYAGIQFIANDETKEKRLSIDSQSESLNKLVINSRVGIDLGSTNSFINISKNVDTYIKSQSFGVNVKVDYYKPDSTIFSRSAIVLPSSDSSLTVVAGDRYSLPVLAVDSPSKVGYQFHPQTITESSSGENTTQYVSDSRLVYSISSLEKNLQGFLQFTELDGSLRVSRNNQKMKIDIGESKLLGFNNVELPSELSQYKLVKSLDFRKNGAESPIYSASNENSDPLSYSFTPTDTSLHILTNTLQLKQGNTVVAEVKERIQISPVTTHHISTDVGGLIIVPQSHPSLEVKTGDTFQFNLELDDYYYSTSGSTIFYSNNGEVYNLGYYSAKMYSIPNVKSDILIYTDKPFDYETNYYVYGADSDYIASGKVKSGLSYTLPTLKSSDIPAGMTFSYWKVGDRPNKYQPGTEIYFTEEERGEIRIEAQFENYYTLWNEVDYFYSGPECTPAQRIRTCTKNDMVYFKLPDYREIIDGRMLYSYEISGTYASRGQYQDTNVFYVDMPSSNIYISAVYKNVVSEVVAENVVIPVGGEPLIERSIHAPEDADYIIGEFTNDCYIVEGDTKHSVYKFDEQNPYIFQNGALYEFEFQFRIPPEKEFIFNPDGYLRDGGCQITIDGLDESDYELVDARFTNNMSKDSYLVAIQITAKEAYQINVTGGNATVNGNNVDHAVVGEDVVLVADAPTSGKAFDKWIISGVEIDESSLGGSRLYFQMPNNEVTATATYKDVSYFTVVFDSNGGTGTIADDVSYGFYTLPPCTFTAPSHQHFVAWEVDGNRYAEYKNIFVSKNITVKAIWALDEHTITFNSNGGTGSMSPVQKEYNSSYTLPNNSFTAPEHKHFIGWALSATGDVITDDSITVTGDIELFAIWANDVHTITFAHSEGASGTMDSISKEYGETYILPTPTFTIDEGKEFKYWTVNGVKTTNESIVIEGDTLLTAIYGDVGVDPAVLQSITLSGTYQTKFKVGDEFNYEGLIVSAHYDNETVTTVTDYTVSEPDMSTAGVKTINVYYTEGDVTVTASYQITVSGKGSPASPKLDAGVVAGIVIAAVIIIGLGGFAIYWFLVKKKTWAELAALFKKK